MARYTDEEKNFIITHAAEMTYQEIANILGRSRRSVSDWCCKNKIKGKREKISKWTQEEIDFVWDNAHKLTTTEIGKALNRKRDSVWTLGRRFGIRFLENRDAHPKTLCEVCKWSTGLEFKCPYVASKLEKPVPGWKAEKVMWHGEDSYKVIECPLYEKG